MSSFPGSGQAAGATLNEFQVSVDIYLSKAAVASRKPPLPKRSLRQDKRESLRTSPSVNDLGHKKIKEKSSWLGLSRGSSGNDQWRDAVCMLVEEEEGTVLKIYLAEVTLYQTIYVHLLHHTNIRKIHHSLFDRKDCLGIFCSPDNTWSSTSEPVYLQFADSEIMNIWLALLRSYASPEVYGRWIQASEGGLYRMWRQVEMVCIQGRNIGTSRLPDDIMDTDKQDDQVDIDVYCEIFVNAQLSGRTTIKKSLGAPDWREHFTFPDLPPFGNMEIIVWRDKKLNKPVMIGTILIALMNFRRGEQVEGWFPILSGSQHHAGIVVGELRLKVRVDEEIILPRALYSKMLQALQSRNCLDWTTELEGKLAVRGIQEHVIAIASAQGSLAKDIMELADREVDGTPQSHTTLFRGNTNLTRTMESYMATYGSAFLEASIGPVLRRICSERISIETDPIRSNKQTKLDKNVDQLVHWCQESWQSIYNARDYCPSEMRQIFVHVRSLIEERYAVRPDNHPDLPWQGVAAFLFLRFFVPAILNPHLFGFWPGLADEPVKRTLTQIAKIIQSLANLNTAVKDATLRPIREFLATNRASMIDYMDSLSSKGSDSAVPVPSPLSSSQRHDRRRMANVLKNRGRSAPTLNREAIPVLPQMIDLPKHLAAVTSIVVRHTRRQLPTRTGAPADLDFDDFCQKCLAVEEQALLRVSQLASRMRNKPAPSSDLPFLKSPPGSSIGLGIADGHRPERKISLTSFRRTKSARRPSTAPSGDQAQSVPPSADTSPSPSLKAPHLRTQSQESHRRLQSTASAIVGVGEIFELRSAQLPPRSSQIHHPRSTSTDSAFLRKCPPTSNDTSCEIFAGDLSEDASRRRKGLLRGFLRM